MRADLTTVDDWLYEFERMGLTTLDLYDADAGFSVHQDHADVFSTDARLAGTPLAASLERLTVCGFTDLPRVPALLVNPGLACPTGPVFRAYDEAGGGAGFREFGAVPPFERVWDLVHWLGNQRNDLQAPAVAAVPEIAGVLDTLEALPDVLLARMSGSGATCFALFDTGDAARRAAAQLSAERPGWWIRATSLGDAA